MRALLLATVLALSLVGIARAEVACILVADAATGAPVHQEGDGCDEGIGPASTFKFALAVMGFDAGVLTDPDNPAWPYDQGYAAVRSIDKQTTMPSSWLENSVLWYSRVLVEKLGPKRFAAYVTAFDYGNADVSGDPGANNGMTHSWLNTSLQITPADQLRFVRRFLLGELPVSLEATHLVARSMPAFSAGDDWTVQGKTGTGYIREANGKLGKRQYGWFVGWATKGDQTLAFSALHKNSHPGGNAMGLQVRDDLLKRWPELID